MGDFNVNRKKIVCLTARAFALLLVFAAGSGARAQQPGATAAATAGIFESHGDVGTGLHPGSVEYDAAKGSYTNAGSGDNMRIASDDFQIEWKKLTGDGTIAPNK